jgi:hypothetical protein
VERRGWSRREGMVWKGGVGIEGRGWCRREGLKGGGCCFWDLPVYMYLCTFNKTFGLGSPVWKVVTQ